jgi:hypothetical protein
VIRLRPETDVDLRCPTCEAELEPRGWLVPGMRNVADLFCTGCARTYYGDLPSGFGLLYPCLVDCSSGEIHDLYGGPWFAEWLREAWTNRHSTPWPLSIEKHDEVRAPLLLNCLDGLYGHSLLKLLNAQHYLDRHTHRDLIVIVSRNLRWLVPDGVAEIWTVDIGPREARGWNDWFAAAVAERLADFPELFLSVAVPHPDPADYDIERFTRTAPKPTVSPPGEPPVVTFAWRGDRTWHPRSSGRSEKRALAQLARCLRSQLGSVDFAVCGLGERTRIDGVADIRDPAPDSVVELDWCQRYAASDVIVGVHGSNMLLPSAHALAAVELVPNDRLGNVAQSLLVRGDDLRDVLFRYRLLPLASSPAVVAAVVAAVIENRPGAAVTFSRRWTDHEIVSRDLSGPRRARQARTDDGGDVETGGRRRWR